MKKPPLEGKPAAEARPTPAIKTKPEVKTEKKPPAVLYQEAQEESKPQPKPEVKSAVSLDQVSKAWRQIRGVIKPQSSQLDALLNSCKLLDVRDNVLILGFLSEILRSKADTPEQMKITRQAIAEVLKVDLGIRCIVSSAKNSTPPDVKADGMVAAALRHGGEIVN